MVEVSPVEAAPAEGTVGATGAAGWSGALTSKASGAVGASTGACAGASAGIATDRDAVLGAFEANRLGACAAKESLRGVARAEFEGGELRAGRTGEAAGAF